MTDTSPQQSESAYQDMTMMDALVVCAKHKRLLVIFPASIVLVVFLVVIFLVPKTYTAATKIMPPQQSQSNAFAILGQIGAFGSVAQSAFGLKNPSDLFATILKSRTISDAIIGRFDLKKWYREEYLVDARKELEKRVDVIVAKDGVIVVEVDDRDPQRAAAIANAYVEELEKLTLSLAVGEASQRRLFFDRQVQSAKESLTKAEVRLKSFQEEFGLVAPEGQAQLTVSASASLQAQIAAKEVQLAAMRSFAAEGNPDLVRLGNELAGLRTQLTRLERQTGNQPGSVLVPLKGAPKAGLEYLQRIREVRYAEALFEAMAKQHEIARVDEAKNATVIQVIDVAVIPELESKPKPLIILLITAIGSFVVAIVLAFVREAVDRMRSNPEGATGLKTLIDYLRWDRPVAK